jgi:hypothetical protein
MKSIARTKSIDLPSPSSPWLIEVSDQSVIKGFFRISAQLRECDAFQKKKIERALRSELWLCMLSPS